MRLIYCHLILYFFFIFLLIHKTIGIYSIQCCTGDDNTCSSKPVDCPSNICFKLVINRITEERGCLDDLIKLLNLSNNKNNRKFNDENSVTNGISDDQCHRLGTYGNGMSLCKCTSHLCNSSSNLFYLTKTLLIILILSVHSFINLNYI